MKAIVVYDQEWVHGEPSHVINIVKVFLIGEEDLESLSGEEFDELVKGLDYQVISPTSVFIERSISIKELNLNSYG